MSLQSEQKQQSHAILPLDEEIHLQDYLHVLFRRRRILLGTFVVFVLLTAIMTFLMRPVYEASATLHVNEDRLKGTDFMEQLGLRSDNPVETEIEILRARTNIEAVVRKLGLDWRPEENSSELTLQVSEFFTPYPLREFTLSKTGESSYRIVASDGMALGEARVGQRFETQDLVLRIDHLGGDIGGTTRLQLAWYDDYVRRMRDDVRAIEVGKGTNIIQVSYQNHDPVQARDVVNTLTQVYLERSIALKAEEARKSVEFIDEQLKEVRKQLDNAEQGLQDYKRESGMVRLDAAAENLIARMAQTEKDRSELFLRKRQAEFAIDGLQQAIRQGKTYAPAALMDDPVLASLGKSLADMEVERQGLMVDRSASHPQIRMLNDRITEAEQKMLATYRSHRETISNRIGAIDQQLRRDEQALLQLPAAEQELARLTRLARVNSDIYTFLLQKHEEARIARAATISSIDVIDTAIVPTDPLKPRKAKNLLLGLAAGLLLGVGLVFFVEYMDDSIKNVEEAKKQLGLPLLAVIPYIGKEVKEGNEEIDSALICAYRGRSSAAEAFRSLRTNLHFAASGQKKTFLITSSFPGEGKTTLAANLALTMSQTGARTLLIGCDLRRPSLSRLFLENSTPGLTEFLIGDAQHDEIIRRTPFENLDFIPSGAVPPNPAELLGSPVMPPLLDAMRQRYDFIILDAPPLFAVTDAALLSPLCDLVLIVLEVGRVPVKVARRLRETLEQLQIATGGMILNDKADKADAYYGYYGSGYYYSRYGYSAYGYGQEPSPRQSWVKRLVQRLYRTIH